MARVIYGGAQRGGAGMGEDFSTARAARRQRSSPERGVPAPKGRYNLRYLAHKDQKAEEVLTGLGNEGRTGAAGSATNSDGWSRRRSMNLGGVADAERLRAC